jgi:hypothetical protein
MIANFCLENLLAISEHAYMALMIPPRVAKELAAMPRHDARRLLERLEQIAAAPQARDADIVPLVGRPGAFRTRQGN